MILPIDDVGKFGVISDVATTALPLNAWTDARNIRFRENLAEKFLGHSQVLGTPAIVPYWLMPVPKSTLSTLWMVAGATKVYCVDGETHTDISRTVGGAYTSSGARNWTGGILGNVPIIHNGVDTPQVWAPSVAATPLIALANWPASTTAKALRVFKQFLVAMDVTKSGTRYPQMVKWSHPADPGAVPPSWDETDETLDAGEYTLSEEGDAVVDCVPLHDVNVLYKESCVYGMQYIGGVNIFRFPKLFTSFGCVSKRCVAPFKDDSHLVFSGEDVILHNGQSAESVLNGRLRKFLRQHFAGSLYEQAFLVINREYTEVWVCFPETGETSCNIALVWNWKSNQWGIRELPSVAYGVTGVVLTSSSAADQWAGDSNAWNTDVTAWSQYAVQPERRKIVLASEGETKLFKADEGNRAGSSIMSVMLEKQSFGLPIKKDTPPDITSVKQVNSVWPRIKGTRGGTIWISIGAQLAADDPISYFPAKPFVIGTSRKIDQIASGVLHSIKFESSEDIAWELSGFDMDYVFVGKH